MPDELEIKKHPRRQVGFQLRSGEKDDDRVDGIGPDAKPFRNQAAILLAIPKRVRKKTMDLAPEDAPEGLMFTAINPTMLRNQLNNVDATAGDDDVIQ